MQEYYGENVLHMAAVAEDPSLVKWLLEIGVDIDRYTTMLWKMKESWTICKDMEFFFSKGWLKKNITGEENREIYFLITLVHLAFFFRRCYGNFFTPADQKKKRMDSLTQEEVILPLQTDYQVEGGTHIGHISPYPCRSSH